MTLSWDSSTERIVIEVFPFTEAAVVSPEQVDEDLEEPEPDEIFLVRLTAGAARAFVGRAAHRHRRRASRLPVLRQPGRPRRPPVRAGQRLQASRPAGLTRVTEPSGGDVLAGEITLHGRVDAGLERHVRRRDRRRRGASTSRSRGERPLWDFPDGTLAAREVAAYARLGGLRLGRRAAHDPARRPARSRHGPAVARARPGPGRRRPRRPEGGVPDGLPPRLRRPRRAATGRSRWCTRTPSRCGGWPSSTSWSTTPTARAATCWRCPTGTATASTTA